MTDRLTAPEPDDAPKLPAAGYRAWNGVRPLAWHRLIHAAETIRAHYHLGLASVWCHINRRDYDNACAALERVIDDIERGYCGPEHDDIRRGYWCPELRRPAVGTD